MLPRKFLNFVLFFPLSPWVERRVYAWRGKMESNRLLVLVALFLGGCAAMLVPTTNDPIEKLAWATELFDRQQRPVPAERLIREAIEICETDKNTVCLGKAYVTYGFFFRSPAIEMTSWSKYYRRSGFFDETATLDNRLVKSKEYFERGISYYLKAKEFDALVNAYLNLGFTYHFLEDQTNECKSYVQSLEYHTKRLAITPDVKVSLPSGVSSFEEYIATLQKKSDCI